MGQGQDWGRQTTCIPDFDGLVARAGHNRLAVGREGHGVHPVAVRALLARYELERACQATEGGVRSGQSGVFFFAPCPPISPHLGPRRHRRSSTGVRAPSKPPWSRATCSRDALPASWREDPTGSRVTRECLCTGSRHPTPFLLNADACACVEWPSPVRDVVGWRFEMRGARTGCLALGRDGRSQPQPSALASAVAQ